MKKTVLIIVALMLVVCAVLFIPVFVADYDAGATKEYKALTYKMVKWNRLYDGDLCYNLTRFYFGKDRNKDIETLWEEIAGKDDVIPAKGDIPPENCESTFSAVVIEINDSSILVEPAEGTPERNSSDRIVVPRHIFGEPEENEFPLLSVGDRLMITYDGNIEETYPAQIDKVYEVVVAGADHEAETTCSLPEEKKTEVARTEESRIRNNNVGKVRFVRSDRYSETKTAFPYVVVIRSKNELEKYHSDNSSVWNFDSEYDGKSSFDDETSVYDEEYFKDNALILVATEEGSGSFYYTDAHIDGNAVNITKVTPEVFTCDMAYWHIIIETGKDSPVLDGKINVNILEESPSLF